MKQVFIEILKEVPPETIVVRYMSQSFTAAQMIVELETETDEGKRYVSECLRVARDIIARQAKKP